MRGQRWARSWVRHSVVAGLLAVGAAALLLVPGRAAVPTLVLEPDAVDAGGRLTVTGTDHTPGTAVRLHLDQIGSATQLAQVVAGRAGGFTVELTVPDATPPGDHVVVTCEVSSSGSCLLRTRAPLTVRAPTTTSAPPTTDTTRLTTSSSSAPATSTPVTTTPTTTPATTATLGGGTTTQPPVAGTAPSTQPAPQGPGGLLTPTTEGEGIPVTTAPQFAGGEVLDLFATAIEVTQGVQDLGNTMPLIPLRPTFARVYVASDGGAIPGTRGILAGFRDGQLLGTVTPLNQPLVAVENGGPRVELSSSLLFRIPPLWTVGDELDLTAFVYAGAVDTVFDNEPESDNNFRSTTVGFHDQAVIRSIVLAPVHIHDGFTDAGADITWFPADHPAELATVLNGLERFLPVSFVVPLPLGFDFDPPGHDSSFAEWNIDENANYQDGEAFEPLNMIQAWREASAEPVSSYPWYGLLPVIGDLDHWNADIGQPVGYSGLSNGTVSMGEMSTETDAGAPFEVKGSKTMAHELGHDLGLGHYGCIDSGDPPGLTSEEKGGGLDLDFPTPFPDCRFAFVGPTKFYGLDVHYDRFALAQPSVIGNDLNFAKGQRAWPLMSYGEDKWVDPYSYCRMLPSVGVPCNAYPPPDQGVPGPGGIQGAQVLPLVPIASFASGAAEASTLLVSGFAREDGTAGKLFEAGVRAGVPAGTVERSQRRLAAMEKADPPSRVALVLYDGAGRELARHPLARTGPPPDEGRRPSFSFVEWVPAPDGLARAALLGDGGAPVLAQRSATPAAPQVEIVGPGAGAALNGPFAVEWRGGDADGDALHYDVLASPDGGATWNVLARQLAGTRLELRSDQLPASRRTRLRVVASDGFRATQADTGDLVVPDAPPRLVLVTGPPSGTSYARRDLVVLSGRASDLEDGPVERLAWSSDRDGDLGSGAEVATRDLSAGEHVITLRATDRGGAAAEATVRVVIDGSRSADVPEAATVARLERIVRDHQAGGGAAGGSSWVPAAVLASVVAAGTVAAAVVTRRRRRIVTSPPG